MLERILNLRKARRPDSHRPDTHRAYFDARTYLRKYPDVARNILHWYNGDHRRAASSIRLLRSSAIFDPVWYKEHYQDLHGTTVDAIRHYVVYGAREGRNPHPLFDTKWYLHQNPDVAASQNNPLVHYILYGAKEGRNPHPVFNTSRYMAHHPDIDFRTINPLLHCIQHYRAQERDRHSVTEAAMWKRVAFAVEHDFRAADGYYSRVREVILKEFDADYYRSNNQQMHSIDPVDHFLTIGWRRGYDPSPRFSVIHYLSLNPDVVSAGCNPLYHFIMWGRSERRSPKPEIKRHIAASNQLAPILFVGHEGIKTGAPVVLLEIVRWYAEHTRRPVAVLLMSGGCLASSYAEFADVYVFHDTMHESLDSDAFAAFINRPFALAYVNSVASGDFCVVYDRFLKAKNVPLVLHVHELSNVIRIFYDRFRALQSRAVSFIAVSDKVRTCLIDEFGCDERDVFLSRAFIRPVETAANNIVALRENARRILGLNAYDFAVLGCGTIHWRKGPDLFLDAATKVIERGLIPNAKFVWVGDGPDIEQYRCAARDPKLLGRVQFVGFRDDASELMAAADVFYLSSREDPFPLVCLEAGQFAVPSLYFEGTTGISEFTGSDAGIGVPSFDTDKICSTLYLLARHPVTLMRLGEVARARVMAGYTAEIKISQIAQHVQNVTRFVPDVSVIVPAYNHADYIQERLNSILTQTIQDFEVIVLDDCSSDATAELAGTFASDSRVRLVGNAVNSGSPFKQWRRGLELARSPLVWIAEGDDSASRNFLETLLPALEDERISLAFCATAVIDSQGAAKPGVLDAYYAQSAFPFDDEQVLVDGFKAVELGFGAMCLIVNTSATLMRKALLTEAVGAAEMFKMCGDWLIYLHALRNGKLFYSTKATNYFRRHTQSAVHKLEGTPTYFEERHKVASFVVSNFNISSGAFRRLLALNENEWHRFRGRNPGRNKAPLLRHDALVAARRARWKIAPMRIGFYVHGMLFSKGGIERLAAALANSLTRRGHCVWIFCRVWEPVRPVYDLNDSVNVVPIFDENDIENSVPRLRLEVARHDLSCFVPMLSEWLFDPIIGAAEGLGVPILASEHNDPWKIEELWWSKQERAACFRKVAAVHLLLERFRSSLPVELASRIHVIPNGIQLVAEILSVPVANRPKRFIGVGRLEPQKRFDRLIKAFSRIAREIPEWRLDIFGEGSEQIILQVIIDRNDLGDRIRLCGGSETILQELTRSSVFVMPSEFEGFGLVVLEAKMAGLAGIAYANCNGPNELIQHDVDGLLAEPDEDGENLAAAMIALAKDEKRRIGMASRARENLKQFDFEALVDRWEELLVRVARTEEVEVPSKLEERASGAGDRFRCLS